MTTICRLKEGTVLRYCDQFPIVNFVITGKKIDEDDESDDEAFADMLVISVAYSKSAIKLQPLSILPGRARDGRA